MDKLPHGLALLARKYTKYVVRYTGSFESNLVNNKNYVFNVVMPIEDRLMALVESVERRTLVLLKDNIVRSFRLL